MGLTAEERRALKGAQAIVSSAIGLPPEQGSGEPAKGGRVIRTTGAGLPAGDRQPLFRDKVISVGATGPPAIEPIALTVPAAVHFSGLSRSEVYRQLAAGNICAVKSGKRTLILVESIRNYFARLPTATFHAPDVV
jgi:hypothetical protein